MFSIGTSSKQKYLHRQCVLVVYIHLRDQEMNLYLSKGLGSGVNGSLFYKRRGYEFETATAIRLSAMNGYTI